MAKPFRIMQPARADAGAAWIARPAAEVASERMLTVQEAAARIGAHPVTIRRWLESGKMKGYRPGGPKLGWRIPESEVERVLRGSSNGSE